MRVRHLVRKNKAQAKKMGDLVRIYDKAWYANCPDCGSLCWYIKLKDGVGELTSPDQILSLQCIEGLKMFKINKTRNEVKPDEKPR